MPAWMKAREVAARVNPREFITIASWLDAIYGKPAKTFGVLEVIRGKDNTLKEIKVILENNRIVKLNALQVQKDYERKKRERQKELASDSIA